jgi:hypothetical protein
MEDEVNSRSYENFLRSGIDNQEEIEEQQEHDRTLEFIRGETSRRSFPTMYEKNQEGVEEQHEHKTFSWNIRPEFKRREEPRRFRPIRYGNIFLGHCYTYRKFGHKEIHYKINARNNSVRNKNYYGYTRNNQVNCRPGNAYGYVNTNYNPFDPLMDQNIICYKCNNLVHKA